MGTDPNQQGSSRRWITRAVEDSLRRLKTDYIDLYQIPRPAPDTDIEESLAVLTDLMRAGKIRLTGTSTFPARTFWMHSGSPNGGASHASGPSSSPTRS